MNTRDPTLSFFDLVHLANTPGPMQGMAQSMLQSHLDDYMDHRRAVPGKMEIDTSPSVMAPGMTKRGLEDLLQRHADPSFQTSDSGLEKLGRSAASGPNGLNFEDATPGHGQYPAAMLDDLVARYGTQSLPPSGDDPSSSLLPAPQAIKAYTDEMDSYAPSLWDKIKSIGHAIVSHPKELIADPMHDMAEYATPVFAQYRGTQDFTRDSNEMFDDPADPLVKTMRYGPNLAMDALQSFSPIGLSARGAGAGISDLLARYGAAAPGAAWQTLLRNFGR